MNRNILYILLVVGSTIFFIACSDQSSQISAESQNQVSEQQNNSEQQDNSEQQVFSEIKADLSMPRQVQVSRSASDWDMFPISVTEESKGNGWKNVRVQIGFVNQKTINAIEGPDNMVDILNAVQLNAEGGYSYNGMIGRDKHGWLYGLTSAAYPPRLKIKGHNNRQCESPDSSEYDIATIDFEVGDTLKVESLSFPNGKTVDINTPEPDYPGQVPDIWLTKIGDEIETSTGFIVSLKSVEESNDKVTFEFKGTNPDPGKGVESGILDAYILGDDGIVYEMCLSSHFGNVSEVGPKQTITFGGDVMLPKNVKSEYAVATLFYLKSGNEIVAFIKMGD